MKIILTTILLASTMVVFGQTTFNYQADFKRIIERTKDTNDNLSYNKLLKRFSVNDTDYTIYKGYIVLFVNNSMIGGYLFGNNGSEIDKYDKILELVKTKLEYKEIK